MPRSGISLPLLFMLLLCRASLSPALIVQTRTIGQVPDIGYNMRVAGSEKECVRVIAEGELRRLYLFVRFDDLGEVQASIQDLFLSIRIVAVDDDLSLDLIDHPCLQIGGFNHYETSCEYFGAWPAASIFSPDDDPLEVANYYLDFSSMIFGRPTSATGSSTSFNTTSISSTYEMCLGNGWLASLGHVQYSGNVVFSESELTLTGLPPTAAPTPLPSLPPSSRPSAPPSACPSAQPSSAAPSALPTFVTGTPTAFNYIAPSQAPTLSTPPSQAPSSSPSTPAPSSSVPSLSPSSLPSLTPSAAPSLLPSAAPTETLAPSSSPLLVDSACDSPQSLSFASSLGALESVCVLAPMSGSLISSLNITLLFTRQLTSFTESPSDLAIVLLNTASGEGLQVGGAALTDNRVSRLQAWPSSWHHMHVAAGVNSKEFSSLLDLSSFQLQGGDVYLICLKNSFYFSEGVQYHGSLQLGGVTTACDMALPVPSASPSLAPSLSLAPTLGKHQELLQAISLAAGSRPVFSFDALLGGGESVCVETTFLAGTPTAVLLSLTTTYKDGNPGASWASDLTITVAVTNSVRAGSGNSSEHCAHVSGEDSAASLAALCVRGGSWPTVMNSGINGLMYANVTVDLALAPAVGRYLGDFDTRQVCISNGFLESEDVRYEGTLSFEGMLTALPPTMTPTVATEAQGSGGSGAFMTPSTFLVAIAVCVFLFVCLLGGTYAYRRNKVVYRKQGASGGNVDDDDDEESINDAGNVIIGVDEWNLNELSLYRNPEVRDRDIDRDSGDGLRINLEEDDDPHLFSALRKNKKKTGLNIHEAKDNNKKSSIKYKVPHGGSGSDNGSSVDTKNHRRDGAPVAPLLSPPRRHDTYANMDLSSYFGDVTYADRDSDRDRDSDGPQPTQKSMSSSNSSRVRPLPLEVLPNNLPYGSPSASASVGPEPYHVPAEDTFDLFRNNSNNSEEMGMIFDPFCCEYDTSGDDEKSTLSERSEKATVHGGGHSSTSFLSELAGSGPGPNKVTLPPMGSLKNFTVPTSTSLSAGGDKTSFAPQDERLGVLEPPAGVTPRSSPRTGFGPSGAGLQTRRGMVLPSESDHDLIDTILEDEAGGSEAGAGSSLSSANNVQVRRMWPMKTHPKEEIVTGTDTGTAIAVMHTDGPVTSAFLLGKDDSNNEDDDNIMSHDNIGSTGKEDANEYKNVSKGEVDFQIFSDDDDEDIHL